LKILLPPSGKTIDARENGPFAWLASSRATIRRARVFAPACQSIVQVAYPVNPKAGPFDAAVSKPLSGSEKQYTQAQIEDDFDPPDWFPGDHPAMPDVVAHGIQPAVKACSKCHLPNGAGHPESSDLAGLPAAYIQSQIVDFRDGDRNGARAGSMLPIAGAISDADLAAAAQYYAALKPRDRTKVVETDTVPLTRIGVGGMRYAIDEPGSEPLGDRIIELPQDAARAELRDSRIGFIAYAPIGSLAEGEKLVTTGAGGKTIACAACHGDDLRGKGDAPPLTGRSPIYMFRQLNDMKLGTRAGPKSQAMLPAVANLSQREMLAIAAYLASRKP
jgi:cytochrome c553